MYACDYQWWQQHIDDVKQRFRGQMYTQWHTKGGKPSENKAFAEANGIHAIEGVHSNGLGADKVHFNSNSGAQAMNLAYLLGATHIYMLGYDMGWTGGKKHWFGDHGSGLLNYDPSQFIGNFSKLANDFERAGVEVVNLSRATKLTQFKRATLDDYDTGLHWIS